MGKRIALAVKNKYLSFSALFLLAGLLVGCQSTPSRVAPVDDHSIADHPTNDFYQVGTGDTLYSVAWAYQLDDQDLIRWNHLTKPYRLHYGQMLRVRPPRGEAHRVRDFTEQPAAVTPHRKPPAPVLPSPAAESTGSAVSQHGKAKPRPEPEPEVHFSTRAGWRWPAEGRLVGQYSAAAFAEKGIKIAGRLGAPVVAALPGVVVYSGAGLRAYGNLVLIKHNQDFMSAYAFNQRNLVKDGENVTAGQKIAEMGQDNAGRVLLYFEIRRYGKPVDPLPYLRG